MVRVLVVGRGFVGRELIRFGGTAMICSTREALDAIGDLNPHAVVNCSGMCGSPNVDACEGKPEETIRANVAFPIELAAECYRRGLYLLQIGSGCIFYGDPMDHAGHAGGWREDDAASPETVYTRSKYAADLALSCYPNVGILRLRMPIASYRHPRNLITKLAGYRTVIDARNSVSVLDDVVKVIRELCELRAPGVFHGVNPGSISHREILDLYARHVGKPAVEEWIEPSELVGRGLALRERSTVLLENLRLPALGIHMRPVREAVEAAIISYGREGSKTRLDCSAAAP